VIQYADVIGKPIFKLRKIPMKSLLKLFRKRSNDIIVISGLPRSGTSMMMRMLEAGGLAIITDNIREADYDNPQGYYEIERVKRLPDGDTEWLREVEGKVIKIISQLIPSLPETHTYKILFMQRNMAEILASQRRMLERKGKNPDKEGDEEMSRVFKKHLEKTFAWMNEHSNVKYMKIDYNQVIHEPWMVITKIGEFLETDLDLERMASVVDPALYRQRSG
jgi:LPS sulfotransferase NodH